MEKITEYLETNIKLAYKTVTFHFKNFVWFYIALFVIQTLLGIVNVSMQINSVNMRESISDKYNSHYVFYSMNTNQKYFFKKAANYYFEDEYFFDIKEIKEYSDETDKKYHCDIYIKFTEDPEKGLERFNYKFLKGLEELGTVYCAPTPLFNLESNVQKNENLYKLYMFIISAVSLVLIASLYNIRTNNFRFDYGIYMAFGADKKKLFASSFWEMTVISFLTFIPSILFSGTLNYILAKSASAAFRFNLIKYFSVLFLTLFIILLSVFFVVIKISIKTPVSLIAAKDNSNLVFSPKVSVHLFTKRPLQRVISLSFFRFVKYYSTLIICCVLFSSLFLTAIFCSQLYEQKQERNLPQFTINYNNASKHGEDDRYWFMSFDGIVGTEKEDSTLLMGLNEHILVNRANAKISANRVIYDDDYLAMDNVVYYATDEEIIKQLENKKYSGDLYSVLKNDNTIIISDSFNNMTHFNFKPGDKIKLADYYTKTSEPDYLLVGKDLLKERLRCFIFKYEEFTIGAVIHDDIADENLVIYMNHTLYKKKTDKTPSYNTVNLYADTSLNHAQTEKLYSDLLKFCESRYKDDKNNQEVIVYNTYNNVYREVNSKTSFSQKLLLISIMILAVSSVIWFFSQTLFYGKRFNDFKILQTFGFKKKHIRRMFFSDALYVSMISTVLYFLMSYILCYAVFRLMNSWLFLYKFRFFFNIPQDALLMGALATFIFSYLSTIVPYFIYSRKQKILVIDN